MKSISLILLIFTMMSSINSSHAQTTNGSSYVLAIHGGAGTILKKNMSEAMEKAYVEALTEALQKGYDQIKAGKTSLDAVVAAIEVMENSPLFNAGKGAVFTNQGKNELDASIMDGKNRKAGAVAGVTNIKNPIKAARAVMDKTEHVLLISKGAEEFAQKQGLEIVNPKYFWTQSRWDGLQKALERDKERMELDHDAQQSQLPPAFKDEKFGTVGCVALDKQGNLAAGTSTGGMTNKKFGRVGDSPIIGAGTYADNETVAISCTGWGEYYIRTAAAFNVSAKMKYGKLPLKQASQEAIDEIGKMGGDGGMIALDKNGQVAMPFNTEGMYRGTVTADGKIEVLIYK